MDNIFLQMSVGSKWGLFQATYRQMVLQSFKLLYQTVYAAKWLAVLTKTVKYSDVCYVLCNSQYLC